MELKETDNHLLDTHPLIALFRKMGLENLARKENSDLECPICITNLPYSRSKTNEEDIYYCNFCNNYFKK